MSQEEAFAYLVWLGGPVASAIAFGLYYGRQGGSRVLAALVTGAGAFVGVAFVVVGNENQSAHDTFLTPLTTLLWGGWLAVGAPIAASYVAGQKHRSQWGWALLTFLGTSLPLLVLVFLPSKER